MERENWKKVMENRNWQIGDNREKSCMVVESSENICRYSLKLTIPIYIHGYYEETNANKYKNSLIFYY